jgi:hypothetical protein
VLPLWWLCAAVLLPIAALWWLDRRATRENMSDGAVRDTCPAQPVDAQRAGERGVVLVARRMPVCLPLRLRCQERLGGVLKHYHWRAA